jgi:hypothetical protein
MDTQEQQPGRAPGLAGSKRPARSDDANPPAPAQRIKTEPGLAWEPPPRARLEELARPQKERQLQHAPPAFDGGARGGDADASADGAWRMPSVTIAPTSGAGQRISSLRLRLPVGA